MFFDLVFNAFLSRKQRERIYQSNWEKSVAQATRELRLQHEAQATLPSTPPPTPPPTPQPSDCTSLPVAPSLSSSSSHRATSSSGQNSPSRPQPSTSYCTFPRPEFRRHLSIQREPISYDDLMSSSAAMSSNRPRSASPDLHTSPAAHAHAPPQQMLYPLPPLGPMEGIGRYRRSADATDEFLDTLQRDTITALQPLIPRDVRVSRIRRREITTPPRTYSVSPPLDQRLAMQPRLASELDIEPEPALAHVPAQPLIEDCPSVAAADPPQQLPSPEVVRANSRLVRVAARRRAYNSRERNQNINSIKAAKPAGQAVGGISRGVKTSKISGSAAGGYKSRQRRVVEFNSSKEALASGEE